jgi:hypothetical protein
MANKCCICGTIRDCGPYLDKIYQNMLQIGALFDDYKIIVYYDTSKDNTLEKLKQFSQSNSKFLLFINKEPLKKYRTHRIAKGRNHCLQTIRNFFSDYEYFIMMDCDDKCAYNLKENVLKYYLVDKKDSWDSLSFQHPTGYYDIWALSKRPFVGSCHHLNHYAQAKQYIETLIIKTPKNQLIQCLSAFNGFAIYKTNKFLNCVYNGYYNTNYIPAKLLDENKKAARISRFYTEHNNFEDCEHRFFHMLAVFKNNARIMIAPVTIFN